MASLHLKQPDGDEKTIELAADITTIGRSPNNTIVLDELTASTFHAEIRCENDKYILHDLNSANGTFVNGVKQKHVELESGDIVHFAEAKSLFECKHGNVEEVFEKFSHESPITALGHKGRELFSAFKRIQASHSKHKPCFVHTVFFWLKDGLTDDEKKRLEKGIASLAEISGVAKAYYGKPASTDRRVIDRSYSLGMTLIFKDQETHDQYQADPIHIAFVNECTEFWTRIQVYDYEQQV